MKQREIPVTVTAIYNVVKLKQEVQYSDFTLAVISLYQQAKGNRPENVVMKYDDENNIHHEITLKEAGEKETDKTLRAVAAVGACILLRNNDIDCETIQQIYCLGHYLPSTVLANRGNIFSNDSSTRIRCRTLPDLIDELLK